MSPPTQQSFCDCSRRSSVEAPAWSQSQEITQQMLQLDIHENATLQKYILEEIVYCPISHSVITSFPISHGYNANRVKQVSILTTHIHMTHSDILLQTVEAQTIQTSSNTNKHSCTTHVGLYTSAPSVSQPRPEKKGKVI